MRPEIWLVIGLALLAPPSLARAAATPADAPAETIRFEEAVSRALARNPTVRSAIEEIRRAEALLAQTRAASLPTVTAGGAYTRLDGDRIQNGTTILAAGELGANVTLTVPLVAPQRWVQWAHARDNVDVARFGVSDVRRGLAISVARTYLALVNQHRMSEASERALATARAHYDFAHQRFAGGLGTRVDEVRAAQEMASDRSQLSSTYAQLARLREALGVLVGADHALDVHMELSLTPPPSAVEALADAGTRRADVRLLARRERAAHRVTGDNWADYMPTVGALFQPFYQNPPTSTLPQTGWQAQLFLTLPLYDGGFRYGLAGERKALEMEARAALENGLRQAAADVRAAFAEMEHAASALSAASEAAKLAAEARTLADLAYRVGSSTNLEVIDAERRARDADTAEALAEDGSRQALLDVLVAAGRFPDR